MPLPAPNDERAWKRLLETGDWTAFSDHALCEALLAVWRENARATDALERGTVEPQAASRKNVLACEIEETLYAEIRARMERVIRSGVNTHPAFVDDVVQKLMADLIEPETPNSRSLRGDFPGARGFFTGLVQNRALDAIRRQIAQWRHEPSFEGDEPPAGADVSGQEEEIVDLDELRTFVQDPRALEVFDLLRAGLTQNAIADQLGINVRTVRRRSHYAIGEIKARLEAGDKR